MGNEGREREEKATIRRPLVELVRELGKKVDESETFDISDTDCMLG